MQMIKPKLVEKMCQILKKKLMQSIQNNHKVADFLIAYFLTMLSPQTYSATDKGTETLPSICCPGHTDIPDSILSSISSCP